MDKFNRTVLLRSLKSGLFLINIAIFSLYWVEFTKYINFDLSLFRFIAISFVYAVLYYFFIRTYDAFVITERRISEMIFSNCLSLVFSHGVTYVVTCAFIDGIVNPLFTVVVLLLQVVLSVLWCFAANKLYFKLFPAKDCLVVYDSDYNFEDLVKNNDLSKKYNVKTRLTDEECIENLELLKEYKTVFIGGIHSHNRNIILKYCILNGIELIAIPRIGDVLMSGARTTHMFHLPILKVHRYNPDPYYLIIKRFFDIAVSLLGLVILSPVFLVTSLLIKKCDGGPVLYKQKRLTKDGKEFMIYKFRSMRTDAEKDGQARLSTGEDDERITPIGKIIRKYRIDELPQLINILKGELSVVGPRPERPEIASEYENYLPEFSLRLQAKAGLTGYAQVYGQYNTSPYDKLQMDLMYISHPSLLKDLSICFATFKILFEKESTEGIATDQLTALSYKKDDDEKETVTI